MDEIVPSTDGEVGSSTVKERSSRQNRRDLNASKKILWFGKRRGSKKRPESMFTEEE